MVLGDADARPARRVARARVLGDLVHHALIKDAVLAGHAALELAPPSDRHVHERVEVHRWWSAYNAWLYHLVCRRPSQRPERRAADQVGRDRGQEGEPVAAGDVEDPAGAPRADGGADAGTDRDHAQNGSKVRAREEIGGLRGDRRAASAPREAEEARVNPEEPGVVGAGDEERADHADDRDAIG